MTYAVQSGATRAHPSARGPQRSGRHPRAAVPRALLACGRDLRRRPGPVLLVQVVGEASLQTVSEQPESQVTRSEPNSQIPRNRIVTTGEAAYGEQGVPGSDRGPDRPSPPSPCVNAAVLAVGDAIPPAPRSIGELPEAITDAELLPGPMRDRPRTRPAAKDLSKIHRNAAASIRRPEPSANAPSSGHPRDTPPRVYNKLRTTPHDCASGTNEVYPSLLRLFACSRRRLLRQP